MWNNIINDVLIRFLKYERDEKTLQVYDSCMAIAMYSMFFCPFLASDIMVGISSI